MAKNMGIKKTILLEHFVVNYFTITCCACAKHKQSGQDELKLRQELGYYSKQGFQNSGPILLATPRKPSVTRRKPQLRPKMVEQKPEPGKGSVWSSTWVRIVGATVIALLVHLLTPVVLPPSTPIINTRDGRVQGRVAYSRDGREFWQFSSIPYAKSPVDQLRFQPPVPAEPWAGVKQVRRYPPFCLQFEAVITQTVFGQEDCLFLNVFTPPFNPEDNTNKKPVLVHIHGGGFLAGSSRLHSPDYLMDQDLVVVTLNYRLGPFGFLNLAQTEEENNLVDLPRGNMGLKDQLLALKWIQNNIANFGGDPNRVTLYGDSAGSVSVHLHVLSQKSRGLFHRAISQSGSAFCSWGFTTQPREVSRRYVEKFKCPLDNSTALLECLQNYDPKSMVKFQVSVTDPTLLKDNLSPSVETVVSREDTFLSQHPTDIMLSGNFTTVPYMYGLNSGEGALRTGRFDALPHTAPLLRSNWKEMLGNVLLLDNFPPSVAKRIQAYYFGKKFPEDIQTFKDKLTLLFSDVFAFEPVQRAARGHAASGAPVYMYYYNYTSNVFPGLYSFFKACTPNDYLPHAVNLLWTMAVDWVDEHLLGGKGAHQYGVSHGEDMVTLWNSYYSKFASYWEQDFSRNFVQAIADFTKGTEDMKFRGVVWPYITIPSEKSNGTNVVPYMVMDNSGKGKVIPEPFADRVAFLNSIGIRYFN